MGFARIGMLIMTTHRRKDSNRTRRRQFWWYYRHFRANGVEVLIQQPEGVSTCHPVGVTSATRPRTSAPGYWYCSSGAAVLSYS